MQILKRTYNKITLLFSTVILTAIIISCNDFGEKDISGKVVVLRAPADSLVTTLISHTFWDYGGAKTHVDRARSLGYPVEPRFLEALNKELGGHA